MQEDISPFLFGSGASETSFVNRDDEIRRLAVNFRSGIHTIMISPRRWGKSSLVLETARRMKTEKKIRFCFIDLFSIHSEQEFYEALCREAIKATSNRAEDWMKAGREFFKSILPRFSVGVDPQNDFSVSFDWRQAEQHRNEILQIPEDIAGKKGIRLVICIDEFQNIKSFRDSEKIEKNLRAIWQHHKSVSYCLYGSKRHMMTEIFDSPSRALYRFGDMFFLQKISKAHWEKFIVEKFLSTGKSIAHELAAKIAETMNNHSYYVQQLSHLVWMHTTKKATDETIQFALNELMNFNALFYQTIIENLSNTQINFLNAVINEVEKFTSVESMRSFKLGTPRNVSKSRTSLENADIIDVSNGKVSMLDPAFELWLRREYFRAS